MQQIGSSDDLPFCCKTGGSSVFSITPSRARRRSCRRSRSGPSALRWADYFPVARGPALLHDLQHPQQRFFARLSATD